MAPTASRRVFMWSISTIFLLGFLWYKRKRSSLRSDPGGTGLKVKGKIENNCPNIKDFNSTIENKSRVQAEQGIISSKPIVDVDRVQITTSVHVIEDKILQSPCSAAVVVDPNTSSASIAEVVAKQVEKNLPTFEVNGDIKKRTSKCVTEIVPEEIKAIDCTAEFEKKIEESPCSVTYKVEEICDSECYVESCKVECQSGELVDEFVQNKLEISPLIAELVEDKHCTSTEVVEEICEQIIASGIETNQANKGISETGSEEGFIDEVPIVQNSQLNPDAADFILNIIKDSAPENKYQKTKLDVVEFDDTALCCDFEHIDKISEVELIAGKVFSSLTNSSVTPVNSRTLVDKVQPHFDSKSEEDQGHTKVLPASQEQKVAGTILAQTVLEKGRGSSLKTSWSAEVEIELKEKVNDPFTVKEEDIISLLDSSSTTAEMARESSSDISHEGPAIEENGTERKHDESSSLESTLSALQLDESALKSAGTKSVKERRGIERDSANHSPADVMLESPSISNYSDVQSEGSSDSGKGGSDVATPPSRTPASGSSVAGDLPLPSVYEFVLPQFLVGRLIGRHGIFVHQIKAKTNANILIKRHPETAKMKICAIEGTQMDIESALEMIRQKFPPKRYPNVTLKQVSFLPPVAAFPLGTDSFQVQLIEGVNNDVILSSLVTPAHFFLQQPTHPTYPALNRLNMCMSLCYNEPTAPVLPTPIAADVVCVAPTMGGWFRAQVVASDPDNETCDVRFMDYGGYLTVENSALRQIRQDFLTLPFQAAECYLANVKPTDGIWTQEAISYVEELTHGQVTQAQICGYAENGIPVIYLFSIQGSDVVVVNHELVNRGYAEFDEPTEEVDAPFEGEVLTAA